MAALSDLWRPSRRTAIAGTVFSLLLAGRAGAETAPSFSDERLSEYLEGRLERFPGAGVVVGIWEHGRTRFLTAKTAQAAPLNEDTVFEIGAVTKTFTATLLADMVLRREVRLEDPIDRFLPRGVQTPTYAGKRIRLVDLATQTSGLPTVIPNLESSTGNPYDRFTERQLYDFLAYYKLKRPIGRTYQTSNLGVGLLGFVLARRAGTSYEALVRERVLRPLGMTETGVALTPAMRARFAPGFAWDGIPAKPWDSGVLAPGLGLRSSARDLLRFVEANATLEPASLGEASTLTQRPRATTATGTIGLGWNIEGSDGMLWHNGVTGGYHTFVGLTKDRTLGLVMLANAAQAGIDEVAFRLIDPAMGQFTPFPPVVTVDAATLDRYVGTYRVYDRTMKIARVDGGLSAQMGYDHPLRIYPSSPTEFFYKAVDVQLTFTLSSAGRVTGLVLNERGLTYEGARL